MNFPFLDGDTFVHCPSYFQSLELLSKSVHEFYMKYDISFVVNPDTFVLVQVNYHLSIRKIIGKIDFPRSVL